ncbi:DUF4012 domain-containing protein [Agromyces sp. CFH 90414]|uniref:DUF4012 domain-containing protein n=1 Tax=Agromyces agglutinans TaxID=2662258 RepID=A0A6I2F849_9MICO|nr:DUF4012 domain-containing protein [Agromyces agglutinans]MRG60444.1 DUF4012 domain-containing protein [Agromyces agglutinans]
MNELQDAKSAAADLASAISSRDLPAASAAAGALAESAREAERLTGDPVWGGVSALPWLGDDLAAAHTLAEAVAEVASEAVVPLSAAGDRLLEFGVRDGAVDLSSLSELEGVATHAAAAVRDARRSVDSIDDEGLVGPLAEATGELRSVLHEASPMLDTLEQASRLLPPMLGADGPRTILALFQNNAELRTGGGIVGAAGVLHVDDGRLTFEPVTATDVRPAAEPVLPLPAADTTLYGPQLGRFIQNATATPDFELSGRLAAEMWRQHRGERIDAVVAIDPMVLAAVLRATGPIAHADGEELSASTVAERLMVDAYRRFSTDDEQNAYFQSVASTMFDALTGDDVSVPDLLTALTDAAEEGRISVWSRHADEQAIFADTTLGGPDARQRALGDAGYAVYLNDRSGGKLGPYLDVSVEAVSIADDGSAPRVEVVVSLQNRLTVGDVDALPSRVTNEGRFGIAPGVIAGNVSVYSPPGTLDGGVVRDDRPTGHQAVALDDGRLVQNVGIDLAPGERATLRFRFIPTDGAAAPSVQVTPGLVLGDR